MPFRFSVRLLRYSADTVRVSVSSSRVRVPGNAGRVAGLLCLQLELYCRCRFALVIQ